MSDFKNSGTKIGAPKKWELTQNEGTKNIFLSFYLFYF